MERQEYLIPKNIWKAMPLEIQVTMEPYYFSGLDDPLTNVITFYHNNKESFMKQIEPVLVWISQNPQCA